MTPWTAARQAFLSFTSSQSLLKLMSIESVILFFLFESVIPSNHLILCHPLLLRLSIFPSIRVFSNESDLRIRWPKYWSFSFSISFSNEYSGLISLGLTGLISLQSKELSKSLLQHHSSKPSILRRSAFTSIHDYWKNHSFDYMDLCWQSNVSAITTTYFFNGLKTPATDWGRELKNMSKGGRLGNFRDPVSALTDLLDLRQQFSSFLISGSLYTLKNDLESQRVFAFQSGSYRRLTSNKKC